MGSVSGAMMKWIQFQSLVAILSLLSLYFLWGPQLSEHTRNNQHSSRELQQHENDAHQRLQFISPILNVPLHTTANNARSIHKVEAVLYKNLPADNQNLVLGDPTSQQLKHENLSKISSVSWYFEYIRTPNGYCRKLVRFGGTFQCHLGRNTADYRNMDGNKLICLDAELYIQSLSSPQKCLVLSFGINIDYSFDTAMARYNCDVHMFDVIDVHPNLTYPQMHFHVMGISNEHKFEHVLNSQITVEYMTLVELLVMNHLQRRPIQIIKIDIENEEWNVFEEVTNQPILDIVGQISLEVHAFDIDKTTPDEFIYLVQREFTIIKAIESRGFRRVAYWDNYRDPAYIDSNGKRFDTCGEMLFVNTNWYSRGFIDQFVRGGFLF